MWAEVPACACPHLLLGRLGRSSAQSPAALWPGNIRCGNLGGADNPQRLAAHPAKQELLASSLIHCKCASMWFQSGAPAPPVLPPGVRQGPGAAAQGRAGSSPVLAWAHSSLLGSLAPRCAPPASSLLGVTGNLHQAVREVHRKFLLRTQCPEWSSLACTPWRD